VWVRLYVFSQSPQPRPPPADKFALTRDSGESHDQIVFRAIR
jgi:hypothetical protein